MNTNFDPAQPKGLVARIATVVFGLVALAAALMFSVVIVIVVAIAGLIVWLYLWWKTRALRQQIRERAAEAGLAPQASRPGPESQGEIIEGVAVRMVDEKKRIDE